MYCGVLSHIALCNSPSKQLTALDCHIVAQQRRLHLHVQSGSCAQLLKMHYEALARAIASFGDFPHLQAACGVLSLTSHICGLGIVSHGIVLDRHNHQNRSGIRSHAPLAPGGLVAWFYNLRAHTWIYSSADTCTDLEIAPDPDQLLMLIA